MVRDPAGRPDACARARGERIQAAAFLLPAVLLVAFGLLYPALDTIYSSFFDSTGTSSSG